MQFISIKTFITMSTVQVGDARKKASKKTSVKKSATVSSGTLDRAMQLLRAFSNDEPGLSITALSERLDLHKSVVSRLVARLCAWHMLERDSDTGLVYLGVGVLQLGLQVANRSDLYKQAHRTLQRLVARTRHTAHVSVLDNSEMLVIATVQSPDALHVRLRQGDRRPLHATGAGKLMLAHMSEDEFYAVVKEVGLPRITEETITDIDQLTEALAKVRESGVAWNEGESYRGVGSCAVGLFDLNGNLTGAITSVFPLDIVSADQRLFIRDEICQSAKELSMALGWGGFQFRGDI